MKTIIISLIVLFSTIAINAQNNWIRKEIGNNLSVSFPNAPTYSPNQVASTYTAQNSNCLFMVLIMRNVIPENYDEFVRAESKWSEVQKRNVTYAFLDNFVKGKLSTSGGRLLESANTKIGEYYGKKIEYEAVNPVTGDIGKRFSIVLALLKYNKVISFECWYLNNSKEAEESKNIFFNSIKVK